MEPIELSVTGPAAQYAWQLLADLGAVHDIADATGAAHSHHCSDPRWHACGLAELTGESSEPGLDCPVPLAAYADGVFAAWEALATRSNHPAPSPAQSRGAELLSLRARQSGLTRRGAISPNGSCRLLRCADGWIAVNLPRASDWELLPAWLCAPVDASWDALAEQLREHRVAALVAQGRLLGLAVADADPPPPTAQCDWFEVLHRGTAVAARMRPPRVVDLSALWAGPLCSRLLAWAGADVTRVESSARPDTSRDGNPALFNFLNHDKQTRVLDLHRASGRDALLELLRQADIVIEGSRPRALRQLGVCAETLVDDVPGLTWLSITAHGRGEPEGNWVGFGDDAAVAAGLSAQLHRACGRWLICGDAIADPFTGMHAALAAQASWLGGGGQLLSLSLSGTVRHAIAFAASCAP